MIASSLFLCPCKNRLVAPGKELWITMHSDRSPLSELLGRTSLERFFRVYWERRPLLIRKSSGDGFKNLLSMRAMDEILSSGFLRHPECRIVKDGKVIPLDRYVVGDPLKGVIDVESLYAEYQNEATITLTSLQRYWRPLTDFCRSMEAQFSQPFQANVYLTRRGSQGFAPHFDTHDVFVLQVAGRKEWRLYDHPASLPGDSLPFQEAMSGKARVRRAVTLGPGDLLYIPRGHIHDANAAEEDSLHITVGVLSATWGDALVEAVNSLIRSDAEFRASLPVGFAGKWRMPADLRGKVARMQAKAAGNLRLGDAVLNLAERFISERQHDHSGRLTELAQTDRLTLSSLVGRRAGAVYSLKREGGKMSVVLYRKKVRFPLFVAPALAYACGKTLFRPSELPGGLTGSSKLLLVRCLIREGLLFAAPRRARSAGVRAAPAGAKAAG